MSNIRVAVPRRRLVAAAAGVAALAAHGPVAAQSWPSRPLKLILPFPVLDNDELAKIVRIDKAP